MRRVPTDPTKIDPESGREGTEPRPEARRQGLAYQGAFEAVAAVPIATGIGYWADGRFDTSPILLLLGAVLGFTAFVVRLFRLGRQLEELGSEGSDSDEPN